MDMNLQLLPTEHPVSPETVLAVRPEVELIACDFHVTGIEQGEEFAGGYRQGRILNVDHHAPTPRMQRPISSANLALACAEEGWLERLWPHDGASQVVLNHNDCDSILSGGIMSRRLPPDPRFGDAAIAADHTGEENEIADLLQGIDAEQSRLKRIDLEVSYRNLERLLRGEPLESFAQEAFENRLRERANAEARVARGDFPEGTVTFAVMDDHIGGEFFPALLPDAAVIVIALPFAETSDRWQVKVRLGQAAPQGLTLPELGVQEFDPVFGGRWNAGSNRRGGGTAIPPEKYAERLAENLEE